jgi:malate dehydrogenase (oxaloacetate-decarboxylating)
MEQESLRRRSDFPNQISNVSVFPSMLRVILDLRVRTLSEELMATVAKGIADLVEQEHLRPDYILPPIDDPRILPTVSDKLRDIIKLHVDKKN